MPQAKPAYLEKAKQLGELIETIIQQPNKPSDELLNKAEALAQPLIFPEETSYYAYQSLGVIAAVRGNAQKTKQYFKCAFNKAPNSTVLKAMFAKALMFLGDVSRSMQELDFYLTHKTGDIFALQTALNIYVFFGQSTKAENIMKQLKTLKVSELMTNPSIIEVWKNTEIPEDILQEYVGLVYQFAAENGIDTRHPFLEVDIEDGKTLYYVLQDAQHSAEELYLLDRKLGEYLIPFVMAHRGVPLLNVLFTVEPLR